MLVSALLKPNSKRREEVVQNEDGTLTIFTKAPAAEGKANKAATQLLADYYNVSKTKIRLVRGGTSKYKTFEILDS